MPRTPKESSTETSSLPTFLSLSAGMPRFWILGWPSWYLRAVPRIFRRCPQLASQNSSPDLVW